MSLPRAVTASASQTPPGAAPPSTPESARPRGRTVPGPGSRSGDGRPPARGPRRIAPSFLARSLCRGSRLAGRVAAASPECSELTRRTRRPVMRLPRWSPLAVYEGTFCMGSRLYLMMLGGVWAHLGRPGFPTGSWHSSTCVAGKGDIGSWSKSI